MSTPLFALPEYDIAFARFVSKAVHELMARKDEVLGAIKTVAFPQIPTIRSTMPSGNMVTNPPLMVEMPFTLEIKDVISGDPENLIASIDNAAEEGLKVVMPHIFDYLGRLCQAAGTASDAKGQKISHELIRQSLEKMQIDFDEDGNPIMPTMIMHPDMAAEVRKLPPLTEEEIRAFNELIERKRREFDDRRRRRKLS
jgi:hypothetical protein